MENFENVKNDGRNKRESIVEGGGGGQMKKPERVYNRINTTTTIFLKFWSEIRSSVDTMRTTPLRLSVFNTLNAFFSKQDFLNLHTS